MKWKSGYWLFGCAFFTFSLLLLGSSCGPGTGISAGEAQATETALPTREQTVPAVDTTVANPETTLPPVVTTSEANPETTVPPVVTTTDPASSVTTEVPVATDNKWDFVSKPAVGAEFRVPLSYDKWTLEEFNYQVVESGQDYYFPWSFTIKNDTADDLTLTACIIHWGFHGWVGFVTETQFELKGDEVRIVSGEDVFDRDFYDQMVYLESIHVDVYLVEE